MEVNNRQFEIEICHLYNLEPTNELNIWRYTDSRFKPFSYLEDKKIQLIRNKIERLLPNKEYKDDDKLSSLELILKKEAENPHVHNGAKSFENIKNYVETDTYTRNYLDRNKNRIACGETKYFYDYHNNRLSRGIALHNINNMWWILMSDGSRRNIASFDLFDYEKHLPRRKQSLARLESFYKKSIESEDFERCIKLKKEIQKHKTSRL